MNFYLCQKSKYNISISSFNIIEIFVGRRYYIDVIVIINCNDDAVN